MRFVSSEICLTPQDSNAVSLARSLSQSVMMSCLVSVVWEMPTSHLSARYVWHSRVDPGKTGRFNLRLLMMEHFLNSASNLGSDIPPHIHNGL